MKALIFTVFALLATMAGCTENDPNTDEKEDKKEMSSLRSQEVKQKAARDNAFALQLLKKTVEISGEKNVFISPLSMSVAIGMAWNGAEGETKSEIEKMLNFSGFEEGQINSYYRLMLDTLPAIDKGTTLKIANSIWYDQMFDVKQAFLDTNTKYFDSEVGKLDFRNPASVDIINNWCAEKTNNLIPEIISEIPLEAVMYLINAVYFKGKWAKPFDVKASHKSSFVTEDNKINDIVMMSMTDTMAYYEDDEAQYVDLPYGDGSFSMTVALPQGDTKVNDYLIGLDTTKMQNVFNSLELQKVGLKMPRYKVESNFQMIGMLKALGMKKSFTDMAEFKKISDRSVYISSVLHKTFMEVNEVGTEAAAVTSIEFSYTSLPSYPMMYVNRPFVVFIREKQTGVILFAGKIGDIKE